jgi:hypothetical protein
MASAPLPVSGRDGHLVGRPVTFRLREVPTILYVSPREKHRHLELTVIPERRIPEYRGIASRNFERALFFSARSNIA